MALFNIFKSVYLSRQQRGDSFTDLAAATVQDSHFHPLDLSYVSSITHKVVHAASKEEFLSLWQVQPQSVRLNVVRADDDDIDPGCGAGITIHPRGQGEVIGNNCETEKNWLQQLFLDFSKFSLNHRNVLFDFLVLKSYTRGLITNQTKGNVLLLLCLVSDSSCRYMFSDNKTTHK